MTPPPAIVALISVSSSSSPRMASCRWRGVMRLTLRSLEALPASSRTSAVRYSNCWVVVFFVEAEFRKRKEKVRVEVVVFFPSKIAEKRGPQASICFSRSLLSRSHARGCPIHPADATPECVRAHQKRPLVKREGSKERRRRFLEKIRPEFNNGFFSSRESSSTQRACLPPRKTALCCSGDVARLEECGPSLGGP